MKTYLIMALLSLAPISELRGSIPYALANNISYLYSYVFCVCLNALVGPIAFILLNTVNKLLCKIESYNNFFNKTVNKKREKIKSKVDKYGFLGLTLFVAIPLPITGAWTGSLGAWSLNMDSKKSCLAILLGVMISGLIVSLVIYSGSTLVNIFAKSF